MSRLALSVVSAIALFVVACQGCVLRMTGSVTDDLYNVKWGYNDSDAAVKKGILPPGQWLKSFGACDTDSPSAHQSPIDINHNKVLVKDGDGLLPLTFNGAKCSTNLSNVGYTLSCMPSNLANCGAYFTTASGVKYKFYEAHLHWHQYYNHRGSEHRVDGQAEAVEAHLVHYNAKFHDIQEAYDDATVGNIAVIAVRYTVAPTQENATEVISLDTFIAKTYPSLRYANSSFIMKGDDLDPYSLIGSAINISNVVPMFYYSGSITTPRCDSIASWFIVQQTVMMSQSQMQQLRFFSHINASEAAHPKLDFECTSNVRPVAPLNGRTVYAWPYVVQPNMSSDSAPDDNSGLADWQLGLIIGGSALAAIVIIVVIIVIIVKKPGKGNYDAIINASA